MLPFTAMRLAAVREPFDHPDWVFELKYDGFRSLAVCDGATAKLVSRKHHVYKSFQPLAAEITAALGGRCAILDGEIVTLDSEDEKRRETYALAPDGLYLPVASVGVRPRRSGFRRRSTRKRLLGRYKRFRPQDFAPAGVLILACQYLYLFAQGAETQSVAPLLI